MTSRAQAGVQLVTDVQTAYKLLEAAGDDPSKLARELARIAPDTTMRVFGTAPGRALPVAGYFIGIGIDLLDPNFATAVLDIRLHHGVMNDLLKAGIINYDDGTYETLQNNIANSQYQEFVQNVVRYKLEYEAKQLELDRRTSSIDNPELDNLKGALYAGLSDDIEKAGEGHSIDALIASTTLACVQVGLKVDDIHTMEITSKGTISVSDEWGTSSINVDMKTASQVNPQETLALASAAMNENNLNQDNQSPQVAQQMRSMA